MNFLFRLIVLAFCGVISVTQVNSALGPKQIDQLSSSSESDYYSTTSISQISPDNGIYGCFKTEKQSQKVNPVTNQNQYKGFNSNRCDIQFLYVDNFAQYREIAYNFLIPIYKVFQIFPFHEFW